MSPWFRRRRRPAGGGQASADARTPAPEAQAVTGPEAQAVPDPEPERVPGPEPELERLPGPEPELERVPGPEPERLPEPEGAISPLRLDQALDRLRHEIPNRDDGSPPASQ